MPRRLILSATERDTLLARAELARAPAPRQRGMDRGGPDFSM